jgi:FAD/FMN-containing dehydrogenase
MARTVQSTRKDMTSRRTGASGAPVPTEVRWITDHPGVHRARVECAAPSSEDELRALFQWAGREGRTITLRGGGQCLHGQSVGDDLVVDLSAFDRVSVDERAGVLTAGAGARWADVRAALPRGWVLPNLVTTGKASVGGTLMADAASRFSSAFGREIDGVRRARLMTADGVTLECDRDGARADLFGALPGSVGVLGALLSVEHALVDVRHLAARDGSLRVKTVVRKHPDARTLLAELALELRAPPSRRCPRGAYGVLVRGCGALLFHSMYTREPRGRRMPNHRRRDPLRSAVERGFHVAAVNRALWWAIFTHYYRDGDHFIDDAEDFAFFMDAGTSNALVQQVLELPFDASPSACRDASALLEQCDRLCDAHAVQPVVWDVLALRGLTRSHALRFTTAVALRSPADEARARAFLGAQARLAREHGARVLPGKGVYADRETLAATMPVELATLRRLKNRWDPTNLFGGPFYEDVLAPAMQRAMGKPVVVVEMQSAEERVGEKP